MSNNRVVVYFLIAVAVIIAAAFILTPKTAANHNGTQYLVLYEDNDGTGDTLIRCMGGVNDGHCAHTGDLGTVLHTQAGYCDNQASNSWNNCVSEIRVHVPAGQCLAMYGDTWYNNLDLIVWNTGGTVYTLDFAFLSNSASWYTNYGMQENTLTSYRFGTQVNGGTGPQCYFP